MLVGVFFALAVYGVGLWILYMFYRALANIGEQLTDLKELLRERLPRGEVER